jgi:hypothetical protein
MQRLDVLGGTAVLQWRNTRLVAVLVVLTTLAASFGSWGWHHLSWSW